MKNLILVPVIMACATGGTIGLIKAIEKVQPNDPFTSLALRHFNRK